MPVYYASKSLIPAPFLDISEEFTKSDTGEIIGSVFNITLTGKLMAWRGSPTSSGSFWTTSGYPADENIAQTSRLTSIITKQKALENLFGVQGQTFQVTGLDGQIALVCNPLVMGIDFQPGIWTEVCDYTIRLQANSINGIVNPASGLNLKSANESWQIELNEQPENDILPQSFRVTHNVGAVGLLIYNSNGSFTEPYIYARNWVLPRLGLDNNVIYGSGVLNIPSYLQGWSQVRSENLDTKSGGFSVQETWIMASGNTLEDFTVSTKTSIDLGVTQVSIQGNIQGLETRDSNYQITRSKYAAASGKLDSVLNNLFNRAQSYSNTALNPLPIVTDIGRNPVMGTISYSYEYDSRPSNYVSGVRSEIVTIVDTIENDVFAVIPVLGRQAGPVLQAINTFTEKSRQLTIELVVISQSLGTDATGIQQTINNNPFYTAPYSQGIADIINAAKPTGVLSTIFETGKQISWQPKSGHFSYSIIYTFE